MNIERGDAERLQMRRPRVSIGEALGRVGCEHADHGTRQIALAHVGEARLVDEMRRVAGVEQVQEVQPALRARGDERRELVIADLRGDEVLGLVPCAGVVDRNPRCGFEARAQHLARLVEEGILAFDQQSHELALRDDDAEVDQQRSQARDGGLALMILREHEAFELGPEVSVDPGRQRRDDGRAVWQLPALAPVEHGQRLHDEVLDEKLLVALEAGALGDVRALDDFGLTDRELGSLCAATTDLARALALGPGRLVHAAGLARLDLRPALQALEPHVLVAQLGVLCLQSGNVLQNLHEQRLQLFEAKPVDAG